MADKVAIMIKSYMRDEAVFNCVQSIFNYFRDIPFKIYIADDGTVSPKKELFYDKLLKNNHFVLVLPEGTGASKSRNELLNNINDERYVLRLDDDFEFNSETNIAAMIEILSENCKIGVVADLERQIGIGKSCLSGDINMWQGDLEIKNSILFKKMIPLNDFAYKKTSSGFIYAICDMTRNMLLFKRGVFKDIRWDNDLYFFGEHEDLLLQIKNSKWDLAFTPNSVHLHRDDLKVHNISLSNNLEKNNLNWRDIFYYKWGIKRIKLVRPWFYTIKAVYVRFISILKSMKR